MLPPQVAEAIYTAIMELPDGTHPDDIMDCICGMIGLDKFDTYASEIEREVLRAA